jgi:hypothetical protein
MRRLIPIGFGIGSIWLCAYLQTEYHYYVNDYFWREKRIGFMETPYGMALGIILILIEVAFIIYCYDV